MSTLKRLRRSLEAGKLIERMKGHSDGYEAVRKEGSTYEWRYANTERESFDTFEDLYQNVEPHASAFTQDELNTWQVASELTEEEEAHAQAFIDAFKAGDEKAMHETFEQNFIMHMERTLFDGSIKNRRAKKDLAQMIGRMRTSKRETR